MTHYPHFITDVHPPFTVTLNRATAAAGPGTVYWRVGPGGGANPAQPQEFEGNAYPGGAVVFGDGETEQTITIRLSDYAQDRHTFVVNLSGSGIDPDNHALALEIPAYPYPTFRIDRDWGLAPAPAPGHTRPPTRFIVTCNRLADDAGNVAACSVQYKTGVRGKAVTAILEDFPDGVMPSGVLEFDAAVGPANKILTATLFITVYAVDTPIPGRDIVGKMFWAMIYDPPAGKIILPHERDYGQIRRDVVFSIAS